VASVVRQEQLACRDDISNAIELHRGMVAQKLA
jgi:hypothetical protein